MRKAREVWSSTYLGKGIEMNLQKVVSRRLILVASCLMSFASFGETQPQAQIHEQTTPQNLQVSLLPALAVLVDVGVTGYGSGLDIKFHLGDGWYLGFETGYYRWSESASGNGITASSSVTSVPAMVTATYKFIESDSILIPYLSVAVGISVTTGSVDFVNTSYGRTKVDLETLGSPGLEISLSSTFSIRLEPKVGLLGGDFLFLPQTGLALAL